MTNNLAVIGAGYVGLPTSILFATSKKYDNVWLIQRPSPSGLCKIEMINSANLPFNQNEPMLQEMLIEAIKTNVLECTSDTKVLEDCQTILVDIQTPSKYGMEYRCPDELCPDYSSLVEGLKTVSQYIFPDTLVSIESTVSPGSTGGFIRRILERGSDMVAGEEFSLIHAPERIAVGKIVHNLQNLNRCIGGINSESTIDGEKTYSNILKSGCTIPMTAVEAEITKTSENALRDLQIATANSLALMCEAMGANFYTVRKGITSLDIPGDNTISRGLLFPGSGVGGPCLTKDGILLEFGVRENHIYPYSHPFNTSDPMTFVTHSRNVNSFMPYHMNYLLEQACLRAGKNPNTIQVALLGWAFTGDVDDDRATPSEDFYEAVGTQYIAIHDPYLKETSFGQHIFQDIDKVLNCADAVVIMTGHREYRNLDPDKMMSLMNTNCPIIVDGRSVIDPEVFIRKGFIYKGIGRGDLNYHPIFQNFEKLGPKTIRKKKGTEKICAY